MSWLFGREWFLISRVYDFRNFRLVQLLKDRWGHYHHIYGYDELIGLLARDSWALKLDSHRSFISA